MKFRNNFNIPNWEDKVEEDTFKDFVNDPLTDDTHELHGYIADDWGARRVLQRTLLAN